MNSQSMLSELPPEVLLDSILPILSTPDLLNLSRTNKAFARLCNDETLWHAKLLADFNFTGAETARSSGWKFIYKNLDQPKVYVWGDRRNGRLGLTKFPNSVSYGVPVPTQLKLPGVRIVSLAAGGWSFHALDSQGNIYVWGTLNSERMSLRSEGYAEAGKTAYVPKKLTMPVPFRSVSCGRMHSSALDAHNKIWTFVAWGRPFRMTCPMFNDPDFTPVQVECGWMFSCVLVRSGEVFAWFPFSGTLEQAIDRQNRNMNKDGETFAYEQNGIVSCAPWDTPLVPLRLPLLPPLPDIEGTPDDVARQNTKLIKIAGFDSHIVGLTNKGHVLKFRGLDNEETVEHGRWTYLPKFSELNAVREHPIYSDADAGVKIPESLHITHVSASYLSFAVYSTGSDSVVLMGDTDTTEESEPTVLPALQNKEIISVVLGDYHKAALTATGKLYTWGKFSAGALGLGEGRDILSAASRVHVDELDVSVPTEVRFDHGKRKRKDRFCLAVAASGWHTGTLVIDLEPDDEESDEDTAIPEPEPLYPPPHGIRQPGETPPFVPLPGIFRVGLAGRHHRGGFAGRQNPGGRPTGGGSSSSGQGGSQAGRFTG